MSARGCDLEKSLRCLPVAVLKVSLALPRILFRRGTGDSIMSGVRRALLLSFLDRYSGIVIAIGSSMVIARLLAPAQLGTFSAAMGLIAFASMVKDLGAGQYLLQERELTESRIRAVWAVQLGMGLGLAFIVAVAAVPAGRLMKLPEVTNLMWVLAMSFAVNPFGSLTYAWLMREMQYGRLATLRMTKSAAEAFVSILLASKGYGAVSLAWGNLAGMLVQAAVSTWMRPQHFPWLPGLAEVRRVLGFGARVAGSTVFMTLRESAPELILVRAAGAASAGYFSRANGLVAVFNRLVTDATFAVAQSLFARKVRAGEDLHEVYVRTLASVCVLAWSFSAVLALLANPIVLVLYGDQWLDSVSLTRWMALALVFVAPAGISLAVLMAHGAASAVFWLSVTFAATTIAFVIGASQFGVTAVAMSVVAAGACCSWLYLRKACSLSRTPMTQLVRPLLVSLSAALAAALPAAVAVALVGLEPNHKLLTVLIVGPLCTATLAVALVRLGHPLGEEIQGAFGRMSSGLRRLTGEGKAG